MESYDVIVAGAGPAGLAAACLLAQDGRRVALVSSSATAHDPRTVALMGPSLRVFEHIGIWPGELKIATTPLRRLRLVDDTGSRFKAPTITFDPADIGEEVFGWNFPLGLLIPALLRRATELGVTIIAAEASGASFDSASVTVRTTEGTGYTARLLLAADGRNSVLREAAGIRTNAWTYEQTALATSFAHSGPHDGVSTEYHKSSGPFTTVPLPGNTSSLVWLERPARAAELMDMADAGLAREIQLAGHGELGLVSAVGPRRLFPMRGMVARDFARSRTLLIGEAAHVVPPIGAQGLNMSLRDAAQAAELVAEHEDPGHPDIVRDYDLLRRRDVQPRQQAIDLMNRSLLLGFLGLRPDAPWASACCRSSRRCAAT